MRHSGWIFSERHSYLRSYGERQSGKDNGSSTGDPFGGGQDRCDEAVGHAAGDRAITDRSGPRWIGDCYGTRSIPFAFWSATTVRLPSGEI